MTEGNLQTCWVIYSSNEEWNSAHVRAVFCGPNARSLASTYMLNLKNSAEEDVDQYNSSSTEIELILVYTYGSTIIRAVEEQIFTEWSDKLNETCYL